MATGHIILPVHGGITPPGYTGVTLPVQRVSTGTPPSNAPELTYIALQFDQTTEEPWQWNLRLPSDYSSGGTFRIHVSINAASGTSPTVWKAGVAVAVPGTTDKDALSYSTISTTSITPDATPKRIVAGTISPSMTNAAADRPITVMVGRDGGDAGDTNTNSAWLHSVVFEYTI